MVAVGVARAAIAGQAAPAGIPAQGWPASAGTPLARSRSTAVHGAVGVAAEARTRYTARATVSGRWPACSRSPAVRGTADSAAVGGTPSRCTGRAIGPVRAGSRACCR